MRKTFIIIVNVIIMAAILTFVVLYYRYANRDSYRRQIEYFENTTVTMEQVTENYLEGEQRVCDVWARYINNSTMTMDEAAAYIRASHVLANTSAHLIFPDTLKGLSTRPKQGTADDYAVSYERVDILNHMNWGDEIGKSINITRAYTNPMNGEQSLAFGNKVTLHDPETDRYSSRFHSDRCHDGGCVFRKRYGVYERGNERAYCQAYRYQISHKGDPEDPGRKGMIM